MELEAKPSLRARLGERLADYPLLRQLMFEFWFLLVFGGILLATLTMGVCLPKMWRVSPPDFLPIVRISLLDMVQAWSLRRSAEAAAASGKFEDADQAWQTAIANNPVDPNLYRGVLRLVITSSRPSQKALSVAMNQSHMLLRLTKTNLADLEITARVYEKFHFHEWALEMLEPFDAKKRPPLDAIYVRALFHTGKIDRFAAEWDRLDSQTQNEPQTALYHTAYLAGWTKPPAARLARQELNAALNNPSLKTTACRLLMAVSARDEDAAAYRLALEQLQAWHEETLLDRLAYWQLLVVVGRRTEAKELALAYSDPPATGLEAFRLASMFISLGMDDHALDFLGHYIPEFRYFAPLWLLYSDLLADKKRWEDLQRIAAEMRRQENLRLTLAGYSFYLQGRADLELNQKAAASDAFREASKLPYGSPNLGLAAASQLTRLGYSTEARAILTPLEANFKTNAAYWNVTALAAHGLRDAAGMAQAAKTAYALQPDNPAYLNNYAAALLFGRQRSEEAVQLTMRMRATSPGSTGARINHCLALILSQRLDEAEDILRSLEPETLPAVEVSSASYARFEIEFLRKNFDRAQKASERIDRQFLFPPQIEWLDSTLVEIAKRIAKKA